jgi:hypothetical protein
VPEAETKLTLPELAYRRWSAIGDKNAVQAELAGWLAAAEHVRAVAGRRFVERFEDEARSLRALADDIEQHGHRCVEDRLTAARKGAVEAELAHIEALDQPPSSAEEIVERFHELVVDHEERKIGLVGLSRICELLGLPKKPMYLTDDEEE